MARRRLNSWAVWDTEDGLPGVGVFRSLLELVERAGGDLAREYFLRGARTRFSICCLLGDGSRGSGRVGGEWGDESSPEEVSPRSEEEDREDVDDEDEDGERLGRGRRGRVFGMMEDGRFSGCGGTGETYCNRIPPLPPLIIDVCGKREDGSGNTEIYYGPKRQALGKALMVR